MALPNALDLTRHLARSGFLRILRGASEVSEFYSIHFVLHVGGVIATNWGEVLDYSSGYTCTVVHCMFRNLKSLYHIYTLG